MIKEMYMKNRWSKVAYINFSNNHIVITIIYRKPRLRSGSRESRRWCRLMTAYSTTTRRSMTSASYPWLRTRTVSACIWSHLPGQIYCHLCSRRLLCVGNLGSPWYDYVYFCHCVVQYEMDRFLIALTNQAERIKNVSLSNNEQNFGNDI